MIRSPSDHSQGDFHQKGISKTHELLSNYLNLLIRQSFVYDFYVNLPEEDVKKIEKFPINSDMFVNLYFLNLSFIGVNYKNGSRLLL